MSEQNRKPLDYEESEEAYEASSRSKRAALLELIPISLIVLGLILRNNGKPYGP